MTMNFQFSIPSQPTHTSLIPQQLLHIFNAKRHEIAPYCIACVAGGIFGKENGVGRCISQRHSPFSAQHLPLGPKIPPAKQAS